MPALEHQSADCIFCRIVAGTAPASTVRSDEVCVAFMDIQPVNPGHMLVVPRQHRAYLAELDARSAGHLFTVACELANALRHSGLPCEGVNLHLADGEAAGQEVFHVHLHVIPRFRGDGFGFKFGPDYGHWPAREELDGLASLISSTLMEGSGQPLPP